MRSWTVKRDTYERKVKHPDGGEETVWLRPLNAGDRAEFNEIKVLAEGDGAIQTGRIQLLMVERAVVDWTLEQDGAKLPISSEIIRQLEPAVFDQLYDHVSFGDPDVLKAQVDGLPVIDLGDRRKEGEPTTPLGESERAADAS
jgi:hypothetical protein